MIYFCLDVIHDYPFNLYPVSRRNCYTTEDPPDFVPKYYNKVTFFENRFKKIDENHYLKFKHVVERGSNPTKKQYDFVVAQSLVHIIGHEHLLYDGYNYKDDIFLKTVEFFEVFMKSYDYEFQKNLLDSCEAFTTLKN